MSNIKEGRYKPQTKGACLCQPISWSMAAILRDSVVVVVVVAVVRTRPRAIPLAMITMRKSIHGFPFLLYMGMGLRRSSAIIIISKMLELCMISLEMELIRFWTKRGFDGAKLIYRFRPA